MRKLLILVLFFSFCVCGNVQSQKISPAVQEDKSSTDEQVQDLVNEVLRLKRSSESGDESNKKLDSGTGDISQGKDKLIYHQPYGEDATAKLLMEGKISQGLDQLPVDEGLEPYNDSSPKGIIVPEPATEVLVKDDDSIPFFNKQPSLEKGQENQLVETEKEEEPGVSESGQVVIVPPVSKELADEKQAGDEEIQKIEETVIKSTSGIEPADSLIEDDLEVTDQISVDFENIPLGEALSFISRITKKNIVVDPVVKERRVDLHLDEVTLDNALNLLATSYGLGFTQIGSTILVSSEDKIKERSKIIRVIRLKNTNAEDIKPLLEYIVDSVEANAGINSIVISGQLSQIKEAERIIKEIDKPQRQVVLSAKVLEIDKDSLKEIGIDYPDSLTVSFQEEDRPSTFSTTETGAPGTFDIYRLARSPVAFDAIIKMLVNEDKARILSQTRLATRNDEEAELFIGDQIPYEITTVTGGVAETEVRFAESGIRLKLTPSVIEDDFVVVNVFSEVSFIYGWRGENDQYPWIRSRKATATVRVNEGEIFVLGGLVEKEEKENLYKLPFLGDIPLLGGLFQYKKNTSTDTEIVITIIPTIIN